MKKFIALAALVLVSMVTTTVYAQESSAQRRADRKAQRDAERARLKAEQQAADAVSYDDAVAALKAQKFVLEANQVMFRNGQTAFVTSNTNFVLVNQGRGTVQVAFNTVYPGPNGIGGVTVDGTVSEMKMSTDKRGNINCNFSIQGIGISAQIFLTLTNGGNNATVTISPNFNSNTDFKWQPVAVEPIEYLQGTFLVKPVTIYILNSAANHLKSVHLQRSFFICMHHERIYHRGQSRYNQSRHDVSVEQTEGHRLAAGSRQ